MNHKLEFVKHITQGGDLRSLVAYLEGEQRDLLMKLTQARVIEDVRHLQGQHYVVNEMLEQIKVAKEKRNKTV